MGYKKDLTGRIFSKLTVIEFIGNDEKGNALWRCKCDCGDEHCEKEITVKSTRLLNQRKKKCKANILNRNPFNPATELKVTRLARIQCNVCNRVTPHLNGVCSWH